MKKVGWLLMGMMIWGVAGNDFPWKIYGQLAEGEGNLFFSPYSVGTAMAMVAEGARGQTRTQLDEILKGGAGEYSILSQELPRWRGVEFLIGNSMWMQQDEGLREEFVGTMTEKFGAELYPVDYVYAPEAAVGAINQWVATRTRGRIRDLIGSGDVDALTRLVLVNAIYFKGEWQQKFNAEQTSGQKFFGLHKEVELPFMNKVANWRYAEDERCQLLELPYKNPGVAMWILLPKEGHTLGELEGDFSAAYFTGLGEKLERREVDLRLPKFKVREKMEVASVLAKMGAPLAFDMTKADFSGISEKPGLFITKVVHQAEMEVDESGTVASAATGVMVGFGGVAAKPVEFTADRPFLYMIRAIKSGAVIFVGRLEQPEGLEMKKTGLEISGLWQFKFDGELFSVPELTEISVKDEEYGKLPVHQYAGGWNDGVVLKGLEATGCSLADALVPDSVTVKLTDGSELTRGVDYQFTDKWATFGRLEGGEIGEDTVIRISYRYTPLRLDSVVRTPGGKLDYRVGETASCTPSLPTLKEGESRVLNVYLDSLTTQLTRDSLFPVLATEAPQVDGKDQQRFIPKTLAKLRNGEKVKILAWGDSVTEGIYLAKEERWQEQFVKRLRECYPAAEIELVSNGWGGRTIPAFLGEPAGSQYNYEETVLAEKADLVISEFVNDAGLPPEEWDRAFPKVLKDFRAAGSEWIILTPHYVRPDWMGLPSQNGEAIENDPRPYVHYLRKFASENGVGLADAAKLYGQLWKQGIPYNMLMTNNINHPDAHGMKLFADALMPIFE